MNSILQFKVLILFLSAKALYAHQSSDIETSDFVLPIFSIYMSHNERFATCKYSDKIQYQNTLKLDLNSDSQPTTTFTPNQQLDEFTPNKAASNTLASITSLSSQPLERSPLSIPTITVIETTLNTNPTPQVVQTSNWLTVQKTADFLTATTPNNGNVNNIQQDFTHTVFSSLTFDEKILSSVDVTSLSKASISDPTYTENPKEDIETTPSPDKPSTQNAFCDSFAPNSKHSSLHNFKNSFCNQKLSLKDRFNYVSNDCGAVLLKANTEATKSSSILFKNKDSYMLNLCSATKKFFIVELCEEILIDTISLSNYEFFSSTFKDISLYSSDRYPPKDNKWVHIDSFTANNTRSNQIFRVKKPKMWAKYVRVDINSHYGKQYYCPISSFAVFGTTQMEKFKYEAEEESMESISNDSPATKTKNYDYSGVNAAYTIQSYINDFEKRILGLSTVDINDILEKKSKHNIQGSEMIRKINPPWHTSDHNLNSNNINADTETKTVININTSTAPPQDLNSEKILSKIIKYNQEQKEESETTSTTTSLTNTDPNPLTTTKLIDIVDTLKPEEYAGDYLENSQNSNSDHSNDAPKEHLDNYDSIYKTITSRLKSLEANMTQVFDFFETQNSYFNQILTKVHILNIDNLSSAVLGLNQTTKKQIRALIDISEEIWRTLLFDIEAYQHKNNEDVQGILKRLDSITSQLEFERRVNLSQMVLLFGFLIFLVLGRFIKHTEERDQIVPKENYEEQAVL
ncbi:hypothetical protein BB561_005333 [Smittium simulii]|uniref:SUN domain-containing protein n=1 Tax=Smittium simulii TaxID=133385 RepID=A0A2T9YB09_9FUNG|nr:hypothetical protein BB561_005333 [Smittium simulii]